MIDATASSCSCGVSSATTFTPAAFALLREGLVDLRQIERLALGFALRRSGQDREEPKLEMVRERDRIAALAEHGLDVGAILGGDLDKGVVVVVQRPGKHLGADPGLLHRVDRTAELGDDDLRAGDRLGRPPRRGQRVVICRMDRAEEVRGRQGSLVDPPKKSIGVEEVVGAARLGFGEAGDVAEVLPAAWGRRPGEDGPRRDHQTSERGGEPA